MGRRNAHYVVKGYLTLSQGAEPSRNKIRDMKQSSIRNTYSSIILKIIKEGSESFLVL